MVARLRRLALALVALAVMTAPAAASPYVDTSRPLTPAELLGTTVHEAAVIVVGEFVGHRLTARDPVSGWGGRLPYHASFRPRRWLKGDEGRAELDVCWWPPPGGPLVRPGSSFGNAPQQPPVEGQTFVVFLRRPDERSPAADSCAWFGIEEGPRWLLPALSPWSETLEQDVRRALQRQEPGELIARADRIVLGTIEWDSSGRPGPSVKFIRVTRALKGPGKPKRLPVRLVDERAIAWKDARPHLFFLRRTVDGVHEPVELIAGVVAVRGERVPEWDLSLDEAVRRIEHAR